MLASHLTSVRSSRGVVPSLGWTPPAPHGKSLSFQTVGKRTPHTCSLVQVLKLNLKNTVRGLGVITYF